MNQLSKAVCDAIDNALTCRIREPHFRVFVDGSLNYKACVEVAKNWEKGMGDPYIQLRNILGEKSVLSINRISSWSHKIREAIKESEIVISQGSLAGRDPIIDTYCFVNSGIGDTAFGAHIDFEDSVIIELAGSGRDIRTWPSGSFYGEIIRNAPSHFGISFEWDRYSETSSLVRSNPGDVNVIKAKQPHIFHSLGPGFFLGLSTIPDSKIDTQENRKISELHESYRFLPINDDNYTDNLVVRFPTCEVQRAIENVNILPSKQAEYNGRKIKLSTAEIGLLKNYTQNRNDEINNQLLKKLIRLGALGVK